MQGEDAGEDRDTHLVTVLACNWQAVQIYQRCVLAYAGDGAHCMGISAVEARAAVELERMTPAKRRRVRKDVLYMGSCAAAWINERMRQERAKQKRGK